METKHLVTEQSCTRGVIGLKIREAVIILPTFVVDPAPKPPILICSTEQINLLANSEGVRTSVEPNALVLRQIDLIAAIKAGLLETLTVAC